MGQRLMSSGDIRFRGILVILLGALSPISLRIAEADNLTSKQRILEVGRKINNLRRHVVKSIQVCLILRPKLRYVLFSLLLLLFVYKFP